jgi:hypothetical protein
MKKHTLLLGLLALTELETHSAFFGAKTPFVKLDEAQLDSIEQGLAKNDSSALQSTIANQAETLLGLTATNNSAQEAANQALALNAITLDAGASLADAFTALGAKCKEYGDSTNSHSTSKDDGLEKKVDQNAAPVYQHENVMNDMSKYPKLK